MSGEGDDTKVSSAQHDDTLLATAPERSSVPTIAPPPDSRYQLGAELGRGGMGRVVEAFDTHLGRTVALKEVLPKAGNIDRRFQREVRITARLEHASIVPLYDSGRLADGRPFYVMRRVSGKPLDEAIARAGSLEGRLALLPNALAAIDAVAHAHKRGVIHRDLKPQNILVGELGETVVIDWGLAKVIGDEDEPVHDSLEPRLPTAADSLQTQVGSVFGTPGFMPPEQARGDELGPSGDVYALGATLYQLIAGKPPFGGTSATDVISSTLRHRLEPITRACPGAPPEMVTIIEKALAFEQKNRYPNAGALAEDVRRFLTGQLVAAHRYTTRQRVARFARRNRAALIVAALAAVGIAVLAWIGVHRIIVERDTAAAANIEAQAQRVRADERAAELLDRADELLLLHARTLLDVNPTQSLAVIKQVEGDGAIRDEALALARAAVMRGVAWGIATLPELTTALEMSRDGKRVLQMNRFGLLQVIDLDSRRQVATHKVAFGGNAQWVDRDRRILISADGPPVLWDPSTGTVEPIAITKLGHLSVNGDGSRIAALEKTTGRIALIDTATRDVTFVPGHTAYNTIAFAPDGSWIAFNEKPADDRQRLVVIEPGGRVLAKREGHVQVFGMSPAGKLAVLFSGEGAFEVSPLATTPVFAPVSLPKIEHVFQLVYRNERLHLVTQGSLFVWTGQQAVRLREFEVGAMWVETAREGVLALTSNDGRVHLFNDEVSHALHVTSRPQMLRITCVPGSSRLVVTAQDALLVFDIDHVVPRKVPHLNAPMFTSESTLVSPAGTDLYWNWLDIANDKITKATLTAQPSMTRSLDVTRDDGRALVVLSYNDDRNTAVIGYPSGKQVVVKDISFGLARLVEGEGFAYSTGKGRLIGKVGDADARELATLDGDVLSIAELGKLTYAALSKKGELVRGRFDGSNFSRANLPDVDSGAFLYGEPGGTALIATGNRLLRWESSLEEVARFATKITWMQATPTGTIVGLTSKDTLFLPVRGDRTPRRMPVGDQFWVADDGARAVSFNSRNEIEILELPSMIAWTLPRLYAPSLFLSIAPSGRRIYHATGQAAVLWTLPEPGSDFTAWLDEQTNGNEVDRHVQWPWQASTP